MKIYQNFFQSFPQAVSFVENLGGTCLSLWKTAKTSLKTHLDKPSE